MTIQVWLVDPAGRRDQDKDPHGKDINDKLDALKNDWNVIK